MKKILMLLLMMLLIPTVALSATYYSWRYLSSADCQAEATGKLRDLCYDTALQRVYKCVPSAGDCDTAGEWKEIAVVDKLGDAEADGTIALAGYELLLTSTLDEAAHSVLKIDNTDADLTAETTLLTLEYTDDGQANGIFVKANDNNGDTLFEIGADGETQIGIGTTGGVIDFGANSLTDNQVGRLQKDFIDFRVETARIGGDFITVGAQINAEESFSLLFDDSTDWQGIWSFRAPATYNESSPTIKMHYTAGVTSGTIGMEVDVMCTSPGEAVDIRSTSFDTVNDVTGGTTVPGTVGYLDEISMTLTTNDGMLAGDFCLLRINRDVDDDDTAAANVHMKAIQLEFPR